jgi:hypothetical protein
MDIQLSPQQLTHFATFGHLLLPQVFSRAEISTIQSEAEAQLESSRPSTPHLMERWVAEKSPLLRRMLLEKGRLQPALRQLLGDRLAWSGSMLLVSSPRGDAGVGPSGRFVREQSFHSDQPGGAPDDDASFNSGGGRRINVHLYFTPTTAEVGALRVCPRPPGAVKRP